MCMCPFWLCVEALLTTLIPVPRRKSAATWASLHASSTQRATCRAFGLRTEQRAAVQELHCQASRVIVGSSVW